MKNFVEIPEYPEYLISPSGEVYSTITKKYLSIRTNNKGYKFFSVNGGTKNILLSRALARVFLNLPSLDSDLEVDHIDGDKENNGLSNLQVLTREEHRIKTLQDKGWSKKEHSVCKVCNVPITPGSIFCRDHYKESLQNTEISVIEIEYWVSNFSWVRASKELGMSDNGLRKLYQRKTGKDPKSIKKIKKKKSLAKR